MNKDLATTVREICRAHGRDPGRLMDMAAAVQARFRCVCDPAIDLIAKEVGVRRVEVESLVSFYAFLSRQPKGDIVIRLCNDVIDRMAGAEDVARAFEAELGIRFGETTPDGKISLEWTPCIGLSDQAPAALVNEVPVTKLSTDAVRRMVPDLRKHMDPKRLVHRLGDGNNAHELVHSMVMNNICLKGPVLFTPKNRGEAIRKALAISPAEVIRAVKTARLRGRGGAGFPTGMKWEFTRAAPGDRKYIVCNADEGEPGTFKDRVLLTELPDRVFAGMTIAGYAIGAAEGILYLRAEYAYLLRFLEQALEQRRADHLLGKAICDKPGFDFDIRIQMGAGAYVCGEETALLSSAEGRRGDPKTRPPFPAQKGYLDRPTVVNNVETLACVTKILEEGPATFSSHGSPSCTGTKLLSISGDCKVPGIFEAPFGLTLNDVLKLAGGEDAIAVQVGGASGQMVSRTSFDRHISFDDLATGGSLMVFGPERNVLEIASQFMEFFIDESCGYCTPCRVGNRLLKERLDRVIAGLGEPADVAYLEELGQTIKTMSRCGLGQTSANPVLTTLKNFPEVYQALVKPRTDGRQPAFDLSAAVRLAEELIGRRSEHAHAPV